MHDSGFSCWLTHQTGCASPLLGLHATGCHFALACPLAVAISTLSTSVRKVGFLANGHGPKILGGVLTQLAKEHL